MIISIKQSETSYVSVAMVQSHFFKQQRLISVPLFRTAYDELRLVLRTGTSSS